MQTKPQEHRILGPLRSEGSAPTVAVRELVDSLGPERVNEIVVEERQRKAIGNRIRELREASPQTNRSIADYVGVGERAVAQWIAGGGIAWDNAVKVAELFEVDVHWLWSGKDRAVTPDVLAALNGDSAEVLHEIRADVKAILSRLDAAGAAQAAAAQIEDDARARRRRGRGRVEGGPASGEQRRGE